MRRLLFALLLAMFAVEVSGLRAVLAGECGAECLDAQCEDDCAPCACCPVARDVAPPSDGGLGVLMARPHLETGSDRVPPSVEPREIFHIPKAVLS